MARRRRLDAALFKLLLFVAPSDFRYEYGRSMWRDLSENIDEELLVHGSFAAFVLFAGGCCDVVVSGLRERTAMIVRDLVFALRSLRKTPLFTVVVVLTLGLAIGANAAVFSVLRAVVLAPLPYADPQRLVAIFSPSEPELNAVSSLPDATDLRVHSRIFTDVAVLRHERATVTGLGGPQALRGFMTTRPVFDILGLQPQVGRFFDASDEPPGAGAPLVISDRMWRELLGGSIRALGRSIQLDGRSFRVIGVAPPAFEFPAPGSGALETPDYWTILRPDHKVYDRGTHTFDVVARLRPGVSLDAANADMARIASGLRTRFPGTNFRTTFRAHSFADIFVGPIRPVLLAAFGAVVGILLIACANVANLLLSRSASRDRELAIRFAIGATRRRIVSQILTETLLFAVAGGALGLILAAALIHGFVALDPPGVPRLGAIHTDASVAAYTFAVVILCTFASGIVPALTLSKPQLSDALKAAGRGGDANRGAPARNAFVLLEIAISVALVITSGLIVRSFEALVNTPLGMNVDNVRVATITALPSLRYGNAAAIEMFYRSSATRVAAIPGVVHAAWIAGTIPAKGDRNTSSTAIEGLPRPQGQEVVPDVTSVGPDYFRVAGIPLIAGRAFSAADRAGSDRVAIVNQAFANAYFHGRAIGKWIAPGFSGGDANPPRRTIVGVVGNVRRSYASAFEPMVYVSLAQTATPDATLMVRVRPNLDTDRDIAAAAIAGDPLLAFPKVRSLRSFADDELARTRLSALLLGSLAVIALFLAVAGVYAVVSFSVAQRTQEFGIRMALGSRRIAIMFNVIARSTRLAGLGILGGVFLAGLAARLMQSQLFGIGTLDPMTYAIVVAIVAAAALLAAWIPAVRATRVDPIVALRYQ